MSAILQFTINAGPTYTGIDDWAAQLSSGGVAVGSAITTGFVNEGGGFYSVAITVADGFQGIVTFTSAANGIEIVNAINPGDFPVGDQSADEDAEEGDAGSTLADAILENARGPKRAQDDAGSVEQHPLADQIKADEYLKSKANVERRAFPWKQVRVIPPGATGY